MKIKANDYLHTGRGPKSIERSINNNNPLMRIEMQGDCDQERSSEAASKIIFRNSGKNYNIIQSAIKNKNL